MRLVKLNEDSSLMWEWLEIWVLVDPWFTSHHVDKETLMQFDKDIPVISRPGTLKKVSSWNYFKVLIPTEKAPFKISVIPTNSLFDPVHFAFHIENEDGALMYVPHGTKAKNLPKADVLITTTTTFELPFWLGGTINLGYNKALIAKKLCSASILVATHDEKKMGKGFVEKLAKKTYKSKEQEVRILKQGEALEFKG